MKQLLILPIALVFGLFSCQKETAPQIEETTPVTTNYQFAKAPTGGGGTPCTPISKFLVKEAKAKRETTGRSIQITYLAAACTNTQNLSITLQLFDYKTNTLITEYPDLTLDGKISFGGLKFGLYRVVILAIDNDTQAVVETKSTAISIVSNGV
jgi:hypothetical protein